MFVIFNYQGPDLTRKQFFCFLVGYFALQALFRGLISETAGIDDVDQILRAQIWSWGYGPQPPLYTWLTKIFLSMFGFSTFSLAILKETVVLGIYTLVYAATLRLTARENCAMAAVALLEFLPSVSWESHRELTHPVLASLLVVATIYAFLLLHPEQWSGYLRLGICGGLGILSKYNFVIVLLALVLAGLSLRHWRTALLNLKFVVAMGLMLSICLPHFNWLLDHQALALSSVHKLKIVAGSGWWAPARAGLGKLGIVLAAHLGLLAAATALLFRRRAGRGNIGSPGPALLWRVLVLILLILVVSIVSFRVTNPRDRYMQPLFVWTPIFLLALLQGGLTEGRWKALLGLSGAVACGMLLVAPGRVLLTERLRKHEVLTWPFGRLGRDLQEMAANADCIIAEDHPLAGNLKLCFPEKRVIDPEVGPLFPPISGRTVLVWDAARSPAPPPDLLRFARLFAGKSVLTDLHTFEEPLKYHRHGTFRLGAGIADAGVSAIQEEPAEP